MDLFRGTLLRLSASGAARGTYAPRGLVLCALFLCGLVAPATVFCAAVEASAEDLPAFLKSDRAEPDKADRCAVMGTGFVAIEGTDTCVKISGSVRAEVGTRVTPRPDVFSGSDH